MPAVRATGAPTLTGKWTERKPDCWLDNGLLIDGLHSRRRCRGLTGEQVTAGLFRRSMRRLGWIWGAGEGL